MLHFIISAAVGGLIGYFTNYIAIKMLFRPREEKKIGNFHIPFTPGVIPRRKDKLAGEIGQAVAEKVFTDRDIRDIFTSEGMKQAVADGVLFSFAGEGTEEHSSTLLQLMEQYLPGEEKARILENIDRTLREKVMGAMERNDMSQRIAYECKGQIRERVRGTVAARVMTEDKIVTLSDYLGRYLQHYIRLHTDDLIMPVIREETASLLTTPADRLMGDIGISAESLREIAKKAYAEFIVLHGKEVVGQFDIAGLTERKIIEFRPEEVEALVMRTIKREMQAVVNLGGVLGVIIGFVAAFL